MPNRVALNLSQTQLVRPTYMIIYAYVMDIKTQGKDQGLEQKKEEGRDLRKKERRRI